MRITHTWTYVKLLITALWLSLMTPLTALAESELLPPVQSGELTSIEVNERLYKALRFGAIRSGSELDSNIDMTSYSVVSRAMAEDQEIDDTEWKIIKLMDKEQVNFEFHKIDSSGKRESTVFSGKPVAFARKYMVDNLLLGVSIEIFENLWNDNSKQSIEKLVELSKKDKRTYVAIVNHIARKYVAKWIEVKDSHNQHKYAKLIMSKYYYSTAVTDKTMKTILKRMSLEAANMANQYIKQKNITPIVPSWVMKPFEKK